MFERKCKICGKTNDLTHLPFEANDEHDAYDVFVCHSCWEIIANIANRAMNDRLKHIEKMISELWGYKELSK